MERTLDLATLDAPESLGLPEKIVGPDPIAAAPEAAIGLVQICAGLPLALRVAGARAAGQPAGSLRRLADRLLGEERRLGELRAGGLAVTASFQVSYDSLTRTQTGAEPARMFRLLSRLAAPDLDDGSGARDRSGASLLVRGGRSHRRDSPRGGHSHQGPPRRAPLTGLDVPSMDY